MTKRAFWLIVVAYAILAVGMIVSLYLFGQQQNDIDDNAKRLNQAFGAACEVGEASDTQEPVVLHQVATGQLVIKSHDCQVIVRKLEHPEK